MELTFLGGTGTVTGSFLTALLAVLSFVLSLTLPRLLVPRNLGVSALTSEAP
jgi:hypothetical protein